MTPQLPSPRLPLTHTQWRLSLRHPSLPAPRTNPDEPDDWSRDKQTAVYKPHPPKEKKINTKCICIFGLPNSTEPRRKSQG